MYTPYTTGTRGARPRSRSLTSTRPRAAAGCASAAEHQGLGYTNAIASLHGHA